MTIQKCKLLSFSKILDTRGNLTFIEGEKHIPFKIKRIYYIYDVPGGTSRGAHAHKKLKQVVIAASGSFDVLVDDGINKKRYHLNRSNIGLYIGPMVWRQLENFSTGSLCLVCASEVYKENDYIFDYDLIKSRKIIQKKAI